MRVGADVRSRYQLVTDVFLYRLLKLGWTGGKHKLRTIRTSGGTYLTYRLNRGDIQSIREVWYESVYRLPRHARNETFVDLGANIGLTSLWFRETYNPAFIVAVEPSKENARLVKLNFDENGIRGELVEAAVGSSDGVAKFRHEIDSNLGHIGERGEEVRMCSMNSVLGFLDEGASIDVLKVDIEGSEAELFSGDLSWLSRVSLILVEFHPNVVDRYALAKMIVDQGFEFMPAKIPERPMDCFVRHA